MEVDGATKGDSIMEFLVMKVSDLLVYPVGVLVDQWTECQQRESEKEM